MGGKVWRNLLQYSIWHVTLEFFGNFECFTYCLKTGG